MKKLVFIMPLMAISLLANCGGNNPSPTVTYHTITFHSNGGDEIPSQHIIDGELAVEPKDPSKENLYFAGWYTDESLKLDHYFSFDTIIKQDYDLYARWATNEEICRITLDCDDKLTLEREYYLLDNYDYKSKIFTKARYKNKYDAPYSKDYYQVKVNDEVIDDFEIERVGTNADYYVNITIPKDKLGSEIIITTEPYCHYLTFTGIEDGATISYEEGNGAIDLQMQFADSLDTPNWNNWDPNSTITLSKNQTIYVKNKGNSSSPYGLLGFSTKTSSNPTISCGGNVMSLLNFNDLYENCFSGLFSGCMSLASAPILPSLKLEFNCYGSMFSTCLCLASAPILPAKTLAVLCYGLMFDSCGSLTVAPKLPAIALQDECYLQMFGNCSTLKIPPMLPAEALAPSCYFMMFYDCNSLKINNESGTQFFACPDTSPRLCVSNMFEGTGGDYKDNPVAEQSYYYTLE